LRVGGVIARAGDVNVVELDTGGMLANGDVSDLKNALVA